DDVRKVISRNGLESRRLELAESVMM
ncbi:hypothetical protein AVEN_202646-1, partial [Araneus ventricosus]